MIVYIDNNGKCHVEDDGTMVAIDIPFFDDKCTKFIEGYYYTQTEGILNDADASIDLWLNENISSYLKNQYGYVPDLKTIRGDSENKFKTESIGPFRNYDLLMQFQNQYERILSEAENSYNNGVNSI